MYQTLIAAYRGNPRDVHTVPLVNKTPLWYHVFVLNNTLYVEPAHNHHPSSNVKRRPLAEKECNDILHLYRIRQKGAHTSTKAQQRTYSQVYWYGIFADLHL